MGSTVGERETVRTGHQVPVPDRFTKYWCLIVSRIDVEEERERLHRQIRANIAAPGPTPEPRPPAPATGSPFGDFGTRHPRYPPRALSRATLAAAVTPAAQPATNPREAVLGYLQAAEQQDLD